MYIVLHDYDRFPIGNSNIDSRPVRFIGISRLLLPLFMWISIFFLLLLGYFGIVSSIDALASADCDRELVSPVECPPLSLEASENDNIDDDNGNIEELIPSVIPFP
jgi:hypothetical protein